MKKKTVFVTSGPRGSGKTTWVKRLMEDNPQVALVIRDEIYTELFGNDAFNPYAGVHWIGPRAVFEKMKALFEGDIHSEVILDYWNGFSSDRQMIVRNLRRIGFHRVICWQFCVTLETCTEWFLKKKNTGIGASGVAHDYALYHKEALGILEDGFDEVISVYPNQLFLPGLAHFPA